MARSRDIEYKVGFTGDTSQLEAAVKKATDSLTKLGTSPDALRKGIDGAARSALELSNHLNAAFNQDTGKLDLIKFQQSLKASGKSIQDYARELGSLGSTGEEAFLNVASAIGKAELPLRRTNNLIKQFGVTLWNTARWRITTGAINTIVGGMQQAVGYAKSLDASLNNIRIVTGKSAEEMATFAKQANAAAKTLSTTTTTYTDASLIYFQQGLDSEAVRERTEATIKMANVTGQSAETISSEMTAIWENFDDGSRSLESFGDSLVALGASTAASSKEIAEGLQKFAPVAEAVGLSFDYASAALTTIVANTRESASVAGNALKTLFSRLEGLKLGETLEDGTDLNKYSNALMAVGVNIKDVSGNLKDMDTILNELGAKWQTLAKDQQMALAETVGGVRQYTQLVALMDNWGDFQKNLVTAQTADGALQRQADIYAESWEAARNRVKAATEDIYDSFINPDQFIAMDDMFTPLLTGIASAVDALGGLTGMLPLVVMLMNKAFGDKIAQSLRDMTVNIGLMTGAEQKRARALQESVAKAAESLGITSEENSVANTKLELLKEEVRLQAEINTYIDSMPLAQKEELENHQKIATILKEQAVAAAERVDSMRELAQEAENGIISTASLRDGINKGNLFGNVEGFNRQNAFYASGKNAIFDPAQINLAERLGQTVTRLVAKFREINTVSAQVSNLIRALHGTRDAAEEARQKGIALLQTYGKSIPNDAGIKEVEKQLHALSSEAILARSAVKNAFNNIGSDSQDVRNASVNVIALTNAEQDMALKVGTATAELEKQRDIVQSANIYYLDWADILVKVGTAASQASMAIRAVGNLMDIFSKDSKLSSSEKLSQGLMSIAMIAPLASKGLRGVVTVLSAVVAERKVKIATEAADLAQSKIVATQEYINSLKIAKGKIEEAMAEAVASKSTTEWLRLKKEQLRLSGELAGVEKAYTTVVEEEAAATGILGKETEKLTKAQKLLKLTGGGSALEGVAAGLGIAALVALIAIYIKSGEELREEFKKQNEAAIQAADNAKEELSNNQKLVDSYKELLAAYKATGEGKDELAAKAQEIANAYHIEGAALAELTGNYDAFTAAINAARSAGYNTAGQTIGTGIEASLRQKNAYYTTRINSTSDFASNFQDQTTNSAVQNALTLDEYGKLILDTTSLRVKDNAEATMQNFAEMERVLQNMAADGDKIAKEQLEILESRLAGAKTLYTDLLSVQTAQDLTSQSFDNFEEYAAWVDKTISSLKEANNLSDKTIRGIISSATTDAGYDEYAKIYNIQADLQAQLQKYPSLYKQVESSFAKITAEEAEIAAYMPWSAVNNRNFDTLLKKTREYVEALQEGSAAAVNLTTAQKLLNQIGSGFKAKDLKEFSALLQSLNGIDIKDFLQLSQDEQKSYLNNIINEQFEIQQQQYDKQINAINELANTSAEAGNEAYDNLVDSFASKLGVPAEAAEQAVLGVLAQYKEVQNQWTQVDALVQQYASEYAEASTLEDPKEAEQKIQAAQKTLETALQNIGVSQTLIEQLIGTEQDAEAAAKMVAEYFTTALAKEDPNIGIWLQSQVEQTRYQNQKDSVVETQETERLARDANAKTTAEQVKNLGELNKLYREGTIQEKAYEAGIVKLAKSIPRASEALKQYNKTVQENGEDSQEAKKALKELSDIVDQEAWGEAISKIKTANQELISAGMRIGEAEQAIDPDKYRTKLGEIAKALQEVFGSDEITEAWVEQHAEEVNAWANGTVETVQAATGTIRLSLVASSQDFETWASDFGIVGDQLAKVVKALDGISFDINGYADMSQVISNLTAAGLTANQLVGVLKSISNANIGFKLTGGDIPNVEDYLDPVTKLPDYNRYIKDVKNAVAGLSLQATNKLDDLPTYTGGGGGGGGGSNSDKNIKKNLEDEADVYHVINRELEKQGRILSANEKKMQRAFGTDRLELMDKEIKEINTEIDKLTTKSQIAAGEAQRYRDILTGGAVTNGMELYGRESLFDEGWFEFGEGGEITNYNDVLQNIVNAYNTWATEYEETMKTASKEQQDDLKKQKEYQDAIFNARKEIIKSYEESLDNINTIYHSIEDDRRKAADQLLQKTTYRMQVVMDVRDAKKQLNDFGKTIAESFGDALTHTTKTMTFGDLNAKEEMAMLSSYVREYTELRQQLEDPYADISAITDELKNLEGNIISSGEALLDWLDQVENMFTDVLSDAADRFDSFIEQLEHNGTVLESIKELYALQGVTYKTTIGFNRLQKVAQERIDSSVAQAKLQRAWYNTTNTKLAEAQKALDDLIARRGREAENDVMYDTLKKNRDALLAEQQDAYEAMLSAAQAAMQTAQEMYMEQLERAKYQFGRAADDSMDLDTLQEKFDNYIDQEERYLDQVNEAYEVASWYAKLQKDIDNTDNKVMKENLRLLQQQIDERRAGNKLSQYDLDVLEAQYKVMQAQMALEDARNNKNQLRLVRDGQGNWNYRYTADTNDIAEKEQDLRDAENEWYNLTKQQAKDTTSDLLATWVEYRDKMYEIYSDTGNFVYDESTGQFKLIKEAQDRVIRLQDFYKNKVGDLETEQKNAMKDMSTAGNESLISSSQSLANAYGDIMQQMMNDNSAMFDEFGNEYSKDLTDMTNVMGSFEQQSNNYVSSMQKAFADYGAELQSIAADCGVSLNELDAMVNQVSQSTDKLRDSGLGAVIAMEKQMDAAYKAQEAYLRQADAIMATVYSLQQYAEWAAKAIELAAKLDGGSSTTNTTSAPDYSALMVSRAIELYQNGDAEIINDELFNNYVTQRNAKLEENPELLDKYLDTDTIIDIIMEYLAKNAISDLQNYQFVKADTGMYTGEWGSGGKLGILHEKELVLNAKDTENILSAVHIMRSLSDAVFSNIGKDLDGRAAAAYAMLGSSFSALTTSIPAGDTNKTMVIENVNFPNAIYANEIEEAINNLINHAEQYAGGGV